MRAQIRDPTDLEVRALTELEAPLVDEIKTAGNHFFAKQQYRFYSQPHAPPSTETFLRCSANTGSDTRLAASREAELLYRSGLGFMGLGPESVVIRPKSRSRDRSKELAAIFACTRFPIEDNRRAATLLLNLAQTLLNLASLSQHAAAAAIEAVTVSHRAPSDKLFSVMLRRVVGEYQRVKASMICCMTFDIGRETRYQFRK